MARSRSAPKPKRAMTFETLLEDLPEEFRSPVITDDLLGSLREYLEDLEGWLATQGVADTRVMALDLMDAIGTSPDQWYRVHSEDP